MVELTELECKASGIATLSICESLLIALSDLRIIRAAEASGILEDAATTHRNAGATGDEAALNLLVATMIENLKETGRLPHL